MTASLQLEIYIVAIIVLVAHWNITSACSNNITVLSVPLVSKYTLELEVEVEDEDEDEVSFILEFEFKVKVKVKSI